MTTTTETPLSCPPSAVHDMITTWTNGDGSLNIQPGDLIGDAGFRARFVTPPRPHEPGDCLIQLTKEQADG